MLGQATGRALMHLRSVNPHVSSLLSSKTQVPMCAGSVKMCALFCCAQTPIALCSELVDVAQEFGAFWLSVCSQSDSAACLRRSTGQCTWRGKTAPVPCQEAPQQAAARPLQAPAHSPSR